MAKFLQGLFDADGCVYDGSNYRYVGLGSASHELLIGVQRLLSTFGVFSRIYETRKPATSSFEYTRKDGTTVEGYLFDRKSGPTLAESLVRVLPRTSNQRVMIAYSDIAALAFTGRDTAAGKSWEAWVKKYVEKKAVGETHIGLEPEALE